MKIADAYGIKGVRIEKLDNIDEKIKEVLDYQGSVCDVVMRELQELMPRTASKKLSQGYLKQCLLDIREALVVDFTTYWNLASYTLLS
jgi:acetolactate synthase-1/2/3 large subunit